jgi:transposase
VRGHLSELGIVAARGLLGLAELAAIVRDESDQRLPVTARIALMILVRQIEIVSTEIAALDTALRRRTMRASWAHAWRRSPRSDR